MKAISVFNNKGGVGKTTLSFHLAHALVKSGKKILIIDADPQCNLTMYCLEQEKIVGIWEEEQIFINDFRRGVEISKEKGDCIDKICAKPRSLHFYLKPAEDGVEGIEKLELKPYIVRENLHLVPGRLTLHAFEERLVFNWSGIFEKLPQPLQLAASIRELARSLDSQHNYDYVIIDTSPSLGRLNRLLISTSDIFLIPCMPDLFSLYGIKNIGSALDGWNQEYERMRTILDPHNLVRFPEQPARFVGYAIVNARKRSDSQNKWQISRAAYRYAQEIPNYIRTHIPEANRTEFKDTPPIGETAIMHSHAGMPSVSQNHHVPMWEVPNETSVKDDDYYSVMASRTAYNATLAKYQLFAQELTRRINVFFSEDGKSAA